MRPWFDFLLQDSANGAKIESALQKKNEELAIRWRDPLLTTSERLKEMSEFHEIERQLREGQDDPKQLETLLKKWKNAGLPAQDTQSTQKAHKPSLTVPPQISGSAASSAPSTTINSAPNGIAISGGNVQNPTVNNFGPPPVEMRWSVRDVVPPLADGSETPTPSQFKFEKEVTVMVSAPYSPVSIGIVCDSHLEDVRGFLRMRTAAFNKSEGIGDDGKTALVYFEGSPATPQQPLIIHVWANQLFSVLQVAQAQINVITAPTTK